MTGRLSGKEYIMSKAKTILKSHGLMMITDNTIVPIKAFNKATEDFKKKSEKARRDAETKGDEAKSELETRLRELALAYKSFVESLHKNEYWNVLPKSYKNIITNTRS